MILSKCVIILNMNHIEQILYKLSNSKFRNSFHLKAKDFEYIDKKGIDTIKSHAYDFVTKHLKDISTFNDGKQTPMKGHPVFIAQHATATCCRGCLNKWHFIEKTHILTENECDYIVEVIMGWIKNEINNFKQKNNE